MPLDPTDDPQAVSNTGAATTTPPPAATTTTSTPDAQQSTPASPTTTTPASPATSTPQQPQQPQFSHLSQDGQYGWDGKQWQPTGSVSNTPPPAPPAVQRASVLRQVAETLAGGPRYQTTIDPQTGATTRTPMPMSKTHIGLAIALEALTGGLTGLAQTGPAAIGKAGAAGVQQGMNIAQQRQQQQQQQDQQAQNDYNNQVSALTRRAAAFEQSSRTVLNTAQSERYGVESLKDAVDTNADLLSSYKDASAVMESNISQDALQSGIQSNKYDPTREIAIPDGFTNINGRYEQTFSIIQNPSAKVPLTNEQAKAFADAGVPGWTQFKNAKIADGYTVPGTMLANANAQLTAINLMKQDVSQVSDALANSSDKGDQELAKTIPNFNDLLNDKDNGPVLRAALTKAQKYVSHSDMHGMDFYQSLQQMASPSKPDPRNPKQTIPNPDAPAAQTIAGAFGNGDPAKGWQVLSAFHDAVTPEPIKNTDEALSIASDPTSPPRDVRRANAFLAADRQQKASTASAEERARQSVSGTGNGTLNVSSLTPTEYSAIIDGIGTNTLDASQMLRYGKADQLKILADVKAKYPKFDATQYQANLGLAKWATAGNGGNQIQALNTLHAHAQDFSENVNALGNTDSSLLNTPINAIKRATGNPNVVSTLGRLLAVRTEYMNVLNNNHALSVEDKADAKSLLDESQSPSQWLAAINQITHTADLRGAETNARYRATFNKDMPNYRPPQGSGSPSFQFTTRDGKMGWNGSAWVSTGR